MSITCVDDRALFENPRLSLNIKIYLDILPPALTEEVNFSVPCVSIRLFACALSTELLDLQT